MKHTLKSLLITTILTLPTAFGAQSLPASDPLTDDSAQEPSSSTCVAADTKGARPLSTLNLLPIELIQLLTGGIGSDFTVGYLDVSDLARLALTARCWNTLAQTRLGRIKSWGQTHAIPRLLENQYLAHQNEGQELAAHVQRETLAKQVLASHRQVLELFSINDDTDVQISADQTLLNALVKIDAAVESWKASMSSNELTACVSVINNNTILSDYKKSILKGLLPNASPDDILRGDDGMLDLGSKYYPQTAALYEKAANHPKATWDNINTIATRLKDLGALTTMTKQQNFM